jgi:hypothetical protein
VPGRDGWETVEVFDRLRRAGLALNTLRICGCAGVGGVDGVIDDVLDSSGVGVRSGTASASGEGDVAVAEAGDTGLAVGICIG